MLRVAILAAIFAHTSAQSPDYRALWAKFKEDYEKPYLLESSEDNERFEVFKRNVDTIYAENGKGLSYSLGITQFADLTPEEFLETYAQGFLPKAPWGDLSKVPFPNITRESPSSVDWTLKGAVNPVKDQAHCGSCWAFSAVAAVESAYFFESGRLMTLSEQNLVSCDKVSHGCKGGWVDRAFSWISANGICSEADYPYSSGTGITGICKNTKHDRQCTPAVTITGYSEVPFGDEDALKEAVAQRGPVSIAVEVERPFQLYSKGILDSPSCGHKLNHAVVIVGYGTDGKDYWKIRNSWGATWGEAGHIRIVRGKNMCGVADEGSYPIGAMKYSGRPTPPPTSPPPPSPAPPPAPEQTHYEDPKASCMSDEREITVQGIQGSFCSPPCKARVCPTDVPSGVTAIPQCALKMPTGQGYCALICDPDEEDECGSATCKPISGTGICTYDDEPPPTPAPPPPTPPLPPVPGSCWMQSTETLCGRALAQCTWCQLLDGFGICLDKGWPCPKDAPSTKNSTMPVMTSLIHEEVVV